MPYIAKKQIDWGDGRLTMPGEICPESRTDQNQQQWDRLARMQWVEWREAAADPPKRRGRPPKVS